MKLAVGLCFYKDLESLKRGMRTYTPFVDKTIAVDGRFSFTQGADLSDKETRDFVLDQVNTHLITAPNLLEHDKRQRYIDYAKGMDAILIIDSDEYVLEADWALFRKSIEENMVKYPNENFFGVKTRYTLPPHKAEFSYYPRLWVRPDEVEYAGAHCLFRNKNTGHVVRSSSGAPKLEGLTLAYDDSLRSEEYLKMIYEYQQKMIDFEIPIRRKYRQ